MYSILKVDYSINENKKIKENIDTLDKAVNFLFYYPNTRAVLYKIVDEKGASLYNDLTGTMLLRDKNILKELKESTIDRALAIAENTCITNSNHIRRLRLLKYNLKSERFREEAYVFGD